MHKYPGTEKELIGFIKAIVWQYRLERVVLFGSLTRGEGSKESDVDLLIVKRAVPQRIHRRIGMLRGIPRVFLLMPLS